MTSVTIVLPFTDYKGERNFVSKILIGMTFTAGKFTSAVHIKTI
jgi:hypothetical protein